VYTHGILRAIGVDPLLGAKDPSLLLRLADEEDPLFAREFGEIRSGDVILALLAEGHLNSETCSSV
jgi:hypothetical protein